MADVAAADNLKPFDRSVYQAIAAYAFDEAEAWPSQQTIADDVGCCRESVNRAVSRLIDAGWLEITEKRRGRRGWLHNVYELLAPWTPIHALAARRITRRAHSRKARSAYSFGVSVIAPRKTWCGCPICRPERGIVQAAPKLPPPRKDSRSYSRWWHHQVERLGFIPDWLRSA
jgi:DNA-binding transcriptional MocR family regulator